MTGSSTCDCDDLPVPRLTADYSGSRVCVGPSVDQRAADQEGAAVAEPEYDPKEDKRMRKFFRKLRKDPDIVRAGRVYVDVPGVVKRRVACSDGLCMRHGRGRQLSGKSCCTTFEVPVSTDDVEAISKVVDDVRQIRDVDRAIRKANGWWRVDPDAEQLWLNSRPSGACVFLSAAKGKRPWCTIHEWALANGVDFRDHKPEGCCLYPLYTVQHGDDMFITSYGTSYMLEMEPEQEGQIKTFDCLAPPKGVGRTLLEEQGDELRYRVGDKRWSKVLARLAELKLV